MILSIIFMGLSLFLLIFLSILNVWGLFHEKPVVLPNNNLQMNSTITDNYIKLLNELIEECVAYEFTCKTGTNISMNVGTVSDLSNDEIIDIENKSETQVHQLLGNGIVKQYLTECLGEKWLNYHIHLQVLGFVLEHADSELK